MQLREDDLEGAAERERDEAIPHLMAHTGAALDFDGHMR
jgi:hypothetical protein